MAKILNIKVLQVQVRCSQGKHLLVDVQYSISYFKHFRSHSHNTPFHRTHNLHTNIRVEYTYNKNSTIYEL